MKEYYDQIQEMYDVLNTVAYHLPYRNKQELLKIIHYLYEIQEEMETIINDDYLYNLIEEWMHE